MRLAPHRARRRDQQAGQRRDQQQARPRAAAPYCLPPRCATPRSCRTGSDRDACRDSSPKPRCRAARRRWPPPTAPRSCDRCGDRNADRRARRRAVQLRRACSHAPREHARALRSRPAEVLRSLSRRRVITRIGNSLENRFEVTRSKGAQPGVTRLTELRRTASSRAAALSAMSRAFRWPSRAPPAKRDSRCRSDAGC
jgi:hypothetical protein